MGAQGGVGRVGEEVGFVEVDVRGAEGGGEEGRVGVKGAGGFLMGLVWGVGGYAGYGSRGGEGDVVVLDWILLVCYETGAEDVGEGFAGHGFESKRGGFGVALL